MLVSTLWFSTVAWFPLFARVHDDQLPSLAKSASALQWPLLSTLTISSIYEWLLVLSAPLCRVKDILSMAKERGNWKALVSRLFEY